MGSGVDGSLLLLVLFLRLGLSFGYVAAARCQEVSMCKEEIKEIESLFWP